MTPEEVAHLSDALTWAIRDRNWSAVADIRDRLDIAAGREPWKIGDPPRPSVDSRG